MIRHLTLVLVLAASFAGAAPKTSETVKYYTVSGTNLATLRSEMERLGPEGFWGYTRWWITWSRDCEIDLEITITMPQLDPSANLSQRDKRVWDAMIGALLRHEQMHAEHGRQAAAEMVASECEAPRRVIRKWAERDRILDRDTQHGTTQGVVLPD